jgi:hypothetical protein
VKRAGAPAVSFGVAIALVVAGGAGCAGAPSRGTDRFVDAPTGEVAAWAASPDGRLRVPLRRGLAWTKEASNDGSLVRERADEGPTYVVASSFPAAAPATLRACAEAHGARVLAAASSRGIEMTTPRLIEEAHRGATVPRVSYAVALEAAGGARPASLMSSWTYVLDGASCYAVGVTTVVRAKADDAKLPDPGDLERLERVYAVLADGVVVASP